MSDVLDFIVVGYESIEQDMRSIDRLNNCIGQLDLLRSEVKISAESGNISVHTAKIIRAAFENILSDEFRALSPIAINTESFGGDYNNKVATMEAIGAIGDAISTAWKWLMDKLSALGAKIKSYFDSIRNYFGSKAEAVKDKMAKLKGLKTVNDAIKMDGMIIKRLSDYCNAFSIDGKTDPYNAYKELDKYISDLTEMYGRAMDKYTKGLGSGDLESINDAVRKELVTYLNNTKAIGSFRLNGQDDPSAILIIKEKEPVKVDIDKKLFTPAFLEKTGEACLASLYNANKSINRLNGIGLTFEKFKAEGKKLGFEASKDPNSKDPESFVKGLKECNYTISAILSAISKYQQKVAQSSDMFTKIINDVAKANGKGNKEEDKK